jgi:serine/threonine protein kinase
MAQPADIGSLIGASVMSQWQIGDWIAKRWEVQKVLEGGCGLVYVVFDHQFRRPLGAKTYKNLTTIATDEAAFVREATTWIRLDHHPSVTQAFFLLHFANKPYLFLEYVVGGNLRKWINSVRTDTRLREGLRLAIEICDGLSHIYERGVAAQRPKARKLPYRR